MNNIQFINQNIPGILNSMKTIAIVGLSNKPRRISFQIGRYLIQAGYKIIPVNPNYDSVLGEKCYRSLSEIPYSVDVVNIFRRADEAFSVVEEAVKINAKAIWMQSGIINEKAAILAFNEGLQVVMNRCIKVEHACL